MAATQATNGAARVQPQSPDLADEVNARDLLARARDALAGERFVEAKGWLTVIRTMRPRDTYVVQQLALATYKSQLPTPQRGHGGGGRRSCGSSRLTRPTIPKH